MKKQTIITPEKKVFDTYKIEYCDKYFAMLQDRKNGIKPSPKPMLVLNPDATDFYKMTIDDFTMENYDPVKPQLSLELGI